jgi:hypothetical protein
METAETESVQFAERVHKLREKIMYALPEEADTHEVVLAGLTLFFQAAYYCSDNNFEAVERMTRDCMELAQAMNEADETVH